MMRTIIILIALQLVVFGLKSQQSVTLLEGVYNGKDLYVKNPYRSVKLGFCVFKVVVNDKVTADEINSSSFKIDLSTFKFSKGDKVDVKIYHSDSCSPKVINPEVLKARKKK